MAKKFDVKQLLVQKGERLGFAAAAVLLFVFLGLGGYVAYSSASSASITNDFDGKIHATEAKIHGQSAPPESLPAVVYRDPTLPHIDFTRYPTPNDVFIPLGVELTKRYNPRILPILEAQADLVRGAAGVLDFSADHTRVSVVVNRKATTNDSKRTNELIKRSKNRPSQQRRGGAPGAPGGGPGMPGGGPGASGGPGTSGSGGGGRGQSGDVTETQFKDVDDKDIEQAVLAEALESLRMVVVTTTVPINEQLKEFARALRYASPRELLSNDFPQYDACVVERQILTLDGKVKQDWSTFDWRTKAEDFYHRAWYFGFESERQRFAAIDADPSLADYLNYIIPDKNQLLLQARPILKRGQYPPVELKTVEDALRKLKQEGASTEMQTGKKGPLDNPNDIFSGGGSGDSGGSRRGGANPAGGGDPDVNTATGATNTGGGRGSINRAPGAAGASGPAPMEDVWVMRFIDLDVHPGNAYLYRIKLKVKNPNHDQPRQHLAFPKLAEPAELVSEPFTLPQAVPVTDEDQIYAAAKDEKARRDTERMPTAGNQDETFVQLQKWAEQVRPVGEDAWPFGDWIIADLKAVRGQYIGDIAKLTLPSWRMANGKFLMRENAATKPKGTSILYNAPAPKAEPVWPIDIRPSTETLLVDFAGGKGQYPLPNNKTVYDTAAVEMLLLSDDGKLRYIRSDVDLVDADRRKREEDWKSWLAQVEKDTLEIKNQNQKNNQPGGGGNPPGTGR